MKRGAKLRTSQAVSQIIEKGEFSLWVPNVVEFDFAKSGLDGEEDSDEGEVNTNAGYKIRGYCSTESVDRQDEVVVQKGLDFSEFVQHGYFNDNHKQATVDIVGIPSKAELHAERGWYTEGQLLRGYAPAEKIVELAKALKSTPRRLGFSIEGKVLERGHDNRIIRAKVRNVAVTNCPVNTDCTWDLVSKAFASADEIEENFDARVKKALCAGHQSPGSTGGSALRKQSVEGKKKKLMTHTRKGVQKGLLSITEAVSLLRRIRPQYSEETCTRIARLSNII